MFQVIENTSTYRSSDPHGSVDLGHADDPWPRVDGPVDTDGSPGRVQHGEGAGSHLRIPALPHPHTTTLPRQRLYNTQSL